MSDNHAYQIEAFADLMVHLDDPFAERSAVLAAATLDEERFRNLLESWRLRIERDPAAGLPERFAAVYSEKRAALLEKRRRIASGEAEPDDARFLTKEAQSFREEAARVAREPVGDTPLPPQVHAPEPSGFMASPLARAPGPAGIMPAPQAPESSNVMPSPWSPASAGVKASPWDTAAPAPPAPAPAPPAPAPLAPAPPPMIARPPARFAGTADISAFVPRGALPFAHDDTVSPVRQAPAPVVPDSPPTRRAPVGSGTADISSAVPRHLFPFANKGAPVTTTPPPPAEPSAAAAEPRRRLIRFDPQTGQPLPAPIWVNLPPDPEGQKK